MSVYLGDFLEDATVYFDFTTNAADGGRESLSASLEEADIVIAKNGTDMTLTASTITITANPGSRVGHYRVSVDMSNDTDFTTGAEYSATLYPSDETVDAQNIAAVLAYWSCERTPLSRSANRIVRGTVNTGITAASTTSFAAEDITEATTDHFNGRTVIFEDGALNNQATDITGYTLTTGEGVFTVTALTETPLDGQKFVIV